jgi:hypothetical protein
VKYCRGCRSIEELWKENWSSVSEMKKKKKQIKLLQIETELFLSLFVFLFFLFFSFLFGCYIESVKKETGGLIAESNGKLLEFLDS